MSRFIDDKIYRFEFELVENGAKLYNDKEDYFVDLEMANYYLKRYTLQKGIFSNLFRKIKCTDGVIRFLGIENDEYRYAEKYEKFVIKDLSVSNLFDLKVGTKVLYKDINSLIYLGFFYVGPKLKEYYFANEDTGRISKYNNLNDFTGEVGFSKIHKDKENNFNMYFKNENGIYLTKEELQ